MMDNRFWANVCAISDNTVVFGGADWCADDNCTCDLEFEIGDVVSLIVGGPVMVVISIADCDCLEVAWADSDGDVNVDVFPVEALCHALLG